MNLIMHPLKQISSDNSAIDGFWPRAAGHAAILVCLVPFHHCLTTKPTCSICLGTYKRLVDCPSCSRASRRQRSPQGLFHSLE